MAMKFEELTWGRFLFRFDGIYMVMAYKGGPDGWFEFLMFDPNDFSFGPGKLSRKDFEETGFELLGDPKAKMKCFRAIDSVFGREEVEKALLED